MQIAIGYGEYTEVDDVDTTYLSLCCLWYKDDQGRVAGRLRGKLVIMASIIAQRMGLIGLPDHKDRNPLNNRRSNLRLASKSQNAANSKQRVDSTTGYKGVSFEVGKYRAKIQVNGKSIHLGRFVRRDDAARAYNEAAVKYFGAFASLNEVP